MDRTSHDDPISAEHLPIFVWAAQADGRSDYYNAAFLAYLGRTRADMGAWSWVETLHPEDRDRAAAAWAQASQAGTTYTAEMRIRRASDGAYRWFACSAQPQRDERGAVVRWLGTAVDIHDRVEAERAARAADEQARLAAEAASRAKDDFLAIVSHELRTPLHAILGWTQILISRGGLRDEVQARAVATIDRNARQQARVIDDILDASRMAAGKLLLEAQPIDLAPLVQGVVESLRPTADAKGVRLSATVAPDAGPVLGDPGRLQQVIWNLVANAIKFTPGEGEVTAALERSGGEAVLVVRDTGAGIRAEFLPYVFDPFRQADSSASRRHGGLGLGLSIVRHLVQLHGGGVDAESPGEGRGATFTVRLPILAPGADPRS